MQATWERRGKSSGRPINLLRLSEHPCNRPPDRTHEVNLASAFEPP
ncbi:hypothetical protein THTE_1974 [Thermogutta terrifontis]|uniref:Uncharacterized protein n=1 Tax=Thermogutta terrifontis TaxID=1331910 RepID=A0A286RF34_9BACT|nr:hypothetical protein THTE_1974 [Thermogutta terrifontis]